MTARTLIALAVLLAAAAGPAWSQSPPAAPSPLSLAASTFSAAGAAAAAATSGSALGLDSDDPVDDRGLLEKAAAGLQSAWVWASYTFHAVFATVTPPTPAAMVKDLQDDDAQSPFFALIGDSGYKIKEIENGVGLPPDVTIKFGRIRNLSDADIDYIDRELARWEKHDPGMVAEAQRAVISTLVAVNQSDSYVIDSVRLRVLPLPQIKFTLAPTEGGLSMENSVLMRAIQRLDRRLADAQKKG